MVNRDKYDRSSKKDLLRRLEDESLDDGDTVGCNDVPEGNLQEIAEGPKKDLLSFLPLLIPFIVISAVVVVVFFMSDKSQTLPYVGPLKNFDNRSLHSEYEVPEIIPRCVKSSQEMIPEINAEVYFAVYVENFQIVAEKNADEKVPFASIVKLLGILVALDKYDIDQDLALLEDVDTKWNGLDLEVGESVSVEDLIGAALVGSRNDAVYVLSQNYPGGEEAFIIEMNKKAQILGMKDTLVRNVIGLDDPEQYSTASDIGILSVAAMRNSVIRGIVSRPVYAVEISSGRIEQIYNTNTLVGDVDGIVGLKTGYTGEAGLCLVSYVDVDRDFVTIVLNAEDRSEESNKLIEWVRGSFSCK